MNTVFAPQKKDPGNGQISEEKIQESIYPNHREVNITDGGEFLDEALRMKEQPLGERSTNENE